MTSLPGSPIGSELLDDPDADPAAIRQALREVARANALFGGWSALRWGLRRLLARPTPPTLSLLDVGTGAGDLPARAARWARRRGTILRAVGVERLPAAATLATGPDLAVVLACGSALPLRDRSFDIVTLSQVAHHLAPEGVTRVAAEMTRVARIGVVLADLRPAPWAEAGFRLATAVLGFGRHAREDGITSLRRGYTRDSLAQPLAAAGIRPRIALRLAPRIVAVWRADGSPA